MVKRLLGAPLEWLSRFESRYLKAARWKPAITSLGGYGSETEARVLGRVLMTLRGSERSWLIEKRGWRQFFDTQVPREPVLIKLGKTVQVLRTDSGGYIDATLCGHGLKSGWHDAEIYLIHRSDLRGHERELAKTKDGIELARLGLELGIRLTRPTRIPVRILGSEETVGIVSDVDDTVMVSMVPHKLLALRYAFVDKVSSRQTVPGMSHFLRALRRDIPRLGPPESKQVRVPLMFLSTGAWNTITVLRHFLRSRNFPRATILLRPWGMSAQGLPSRGPAFKRKELERLVGMFPQVRWILIGDNGQHDPEIFTAFAKSHPGAVAAVAIRTLLPFQHISAHGSPAERTSLQVSDLPPGLPVIFGSDGYHLLREAQTTRFRAQLSRRLRTAWPEGPSASLSPQPRTQQRFGCEL